MVSAQESQVAREWRDRLLRFEKSGLSVTEFCELEDYTTASLYYWRRKLQSLPHSSVKPASVSLDVPAVSSARTRSRDGLRIVLPGGAVIRLAGHASDEQQRRVIKNVVESMREVQS